VINRRNLLALGASAAAVSALPQITMGFDLSPIDHDSEAFWDSIRAQYDITDAVVNLENGYWGIMPKPVLNHYITQTKMVNENGAYYTRRYYDQDYGAIIARLAGLLKVSPDELVLTRNATEALQNLITGYDKLKPGDSIMYADLDYHSMQASMDWLLESRGVTLAKLTIPEPASHETILETYETAFKANPNCRLLLLTHLSHRTGLVMPVRAITTLARTYDIDVILDAAHSWGQLDFTLPDLAVDFVGFNLHKWISAPLGVGMMYIRKDRIPDIAVYRGDKPKDPTRIGARVHTGTVNMAAVLSVPKALDFHEMIGPKHKENRLRSLRDMWVAAFRDHPKLEILTPDDARLHGGITSFRIKGKTTDADNIRLAKTLLDDHGIFTVYRNGVAKGSCVRVTPGLYSSRQDVEKFIEALGKIVA